MPERDPERGAWLRRGREQRGWGTTEMALRLIRAGRDNDDSTIPGMRTMLRNVQRWEEGRAITPRYRLLYCRAFGIGPAQFGKPGAESPDPAPAPETAALAVPATSPETPMPDLADPYLPPTAIMTYRGRGDFGSGDYAVEREVLMAAHEGSDHTEEYEQHGIGDVTSEQLRADVVRLARATDTDPPLPTFLDLRRVRSRIYRLLDRRLWPREQTELHLLLGCVSGLMGVNASALGYLDAAEELIRAGYASAAGIGHRSLQAHLRRQLSSVVYLLGRFEESSALALSGLEFLSDGPEAGYLHLCHALAAAARGDADTARAAVNQAHDARERDYRDDLTSIGGEFAVSKATHYAHAGHAFASVTGAERDAAGELDEAISLYEAGPGPGEQHWFGGKARAGVNLAVVRLRSGALDAAAAALEPAMALPVERRASSITAPLAEVRRELAAPVFRGSPQARDLGEQIEAFGRDAVASGLRSLTG